MLKYEDITGKVLSACFEVMNELGSGFLEGVYEKSLIIALKERGLKAENQVPLRVFFKGNCVGEYFADVVVADKVIVELKAVKALSNEHQAQLINYLKATGMEVGMLINFGRPKVEYKRFYNNKNKIKSQDWSWDRIYMDEQNVQDKITNWF